ncbi:hypothetical protein ACFP1L_09930 [Lactiplantibacillus nangangensis]|uniref:Extracellular protein n=1 Tax=Lactiplantibacillus nangangensis TaxID=2559917 RepID=A0ABW1SKT1_9LACO|nr:hypothetical protein [Lactiplantibacillus nangangensis]
MKKLIVSTSVLIGVAVLGGGYLLWPNGAQSSTPVATTTMSSAVTKKDTSKANNSQTAQSKAATSSATSASKSTAVASSSSTTQTADSSSDSQSASQATTSSTATSSSTTATSTTSYLTAEQVNDWAWQQVATEYQGTKMTKADFSFNQTRKPDKLVYVEVREANNDQVSHLVATFRVNAQGQLEKQDTTKGADAWDVVAQSYQ